MLFGIVHAQQWIPVGPDGGDARSLAADPNRPGRILLGTSAGQLYESLDSGGSWQRLARLGSGNDYVIDHILFDTSHTGVIYAGAWSIEESATQHNGDIFRSANNGRTWTALTPMHGESVRALTMAASDPDTLVAGTLNGVFRTSDGGATWKRISPPKNSELRNIESIAIDPRNPDVIYAGTWHLPWKTSDGGKTWKSIKSGIIDDSDVFSIIIDPQHPDSIYASACSGIYKSDNAGDTFRKIQGIPYSSRRTRMLHQDPRDPRLVYAGTTEGLFKTLDAGNSWSHTTGDSLIVNDILSDPTRVGHVLIATDRAGVLSSDDYGNTFSSSSRGFAHRQVATVLADQLKPDTFYAGVLNDKEFGGVFVTNNYGSSWSQMNRGLDGRDVFTLRQSPNGDLLAGTNRGIFLWSKSEDKTEFEWVPLNNVFTMVETPITIPEKLAKGKPNVRSFAHAVKSEFTLRVNDLFLVPGRWFAATVEGLYISNDDGRSWEGGVVDSVSDFVAVRRTGDITLAAARRGLLISTDGGYHWQRSKLPEGINIITDAAADAYGNIFLAALDGLYRSKNSGTTWELVRSLNTNQVTSIYYDEDGARLLAASPISSSLWSSRDAGTTWQPIETGWRLRSVRVVRGRIIATSAFDGVITQPNTGLTAQSQNGFSISVNQNYK